MLLAMLTKARSTENLGSVLANTFWSKKSYLFPTCVSFVVECIFVDKDKDDNSYVTVELIVYYNNDIYT